jgi:hypothetical protein
MSLAHIKALALMANMTLMVPITLFCCVYTALLRSIMEYGALRCSPKCTTASGLKSCRSQRHHSGEQTTNDSHRGWNQLRPDHVVTSAIAWLKRDY